MVLQVRRTARLLLWPHVLVSVGAVSVLREGLGGGNDLFCCYYHCYYHYYHYNCYHYRCYHYHCIIIVIRIIINNIEIIYDDTDSIIMNTNSTDLFWNVRTPQQRQQ